MRKAHYYVQISNKGKLENGATTIWFIIVLLAFWMIFLIRDILIKYMYSLINSDITDE